MMKLQATTLSMSLLILAAACGAPETPSGQPEYAVTEDAASVNTSALRVSDGLGASTLAAVDALALVAVELASEDAGEYIEAEFDCDVAVERGWVPYDAASLELTFPAEGCEGPNGYLWQGELTVALESVRDENGRVEAMVGRIAADVTITNLANSNDLHLVGETTVTRDADGSTVEMNGAIDGHAQVALDMSGFVFEGRAGYTGAIAMSTFRATAECRSIGDANLDVTAVLDNENHDPDARWFETATYWQSITMPLSVEVPFEGDDVLTAAYTAGPFVVQTNGGSAEMGQPVEGSFDLELPACPGEVSQPTRPSRNNPRGR